MLSFQIADRNEFRRAFSAATVHDMFNWCTVAVMLTIEVPSQPAKKNATLEHYVVLSTTL